MQSLCRVARAYAVQTVGRAQPAGRALPSRPAVVGLSHRILHTDLPSEKQDSHPSIDTKNRFVYAAELLKSKPYFQSFHKNSSLSTSNDDLRRVLARPLLIDTLKLVRKFEEAGLPTKQAEAITNLIADLMTNTSDRMSDTFLSKSEAEQMNIKNDAAVQMFRHDMQQSYENEMAKLQRDIERQRVELEKLRAELRYEVDKVTSGHRLDLNLERGRIRDELQLLDTRATDNTARLDREINIVRTNIEAGRSEIIKYCVGTIVSTVALGLAVIRLLM